MFGFMEQLVISLHACSNAICDKIKQSAEGTIQAVTEFIGRRGNELNQSEVSRFRLLTRYSLSFITWVDVFFPYNLRSSLQNCAIFALCHSACN